MQIEQALTFDDVLLKPDYSNVEPHEVHTDTCLTPGIRLNIPLASAAMDTVTEADAAIALAREGVVGIIHKNMSIEEQAQEVKKVKKAESGVIVDPITVSPDVQVKKILELIEKYNISGIPVVKGNELVGLITKRDIAFVSPETFAKDVMTVDLVTIPPGADLEETKRILHQYRVEKLPVVQKDGSLYGMVTKRDVDRRQQYPLACKDDKKRLRVGAAIGVDDSSQKRVSALVEAGVDVVGVDTAHADSEKVHNLVGYIKKTFQDVGVIAGNVATKEAAQRLVDLGVDAIKVGIGAGSICTTRVVAGVGVPQLTAILECSKVAKKAGVCLVADGGVRYSGDIVKAIAAGADTVMIGSILAGAEETPGEQVLYRGRKYKLYRGMGSIGAMKEGSGDRYGQENSSKFVPEGVEGRIPYKGLLADIVYQLVGGIRSGMGYTGCSTIVELQTNAKFVQNTAAGMRESHPHDVLISQEAPNYQVE